MNHESVPGMEFRSPTVTVRPRIMFTICPCIVNRGKWKSAWLNSFIPCFISCIRRFILSSGDVCSSLSSPGPNNFFFIQNNGSNIMNRGGPLDIRRRPLKFSLLTNYKEITEIGKKNFVCPFTFPSFEKNSLIFGILCLSGKIRFVILIKFTFSFSQFEASFVSRYKKKQIHKNEKF